MITLVGVGRLIKAALALEGVGAMTRMVQILKGAEAVVVEEMEDCWGPDEELNSLYWDLRLVREELERKLGLRHY